MKLALIARGLMVLLCGWLSGWWQETHSSFEFTVVALLIGILLHLPVPKSQHLQASDS